MLVDFRSWVFDEKLGVLPNAQKELLQREFNALKTIIDDDILEVREMKPFSIADLFFENSETIAVSPVKKIEHFYGLIDQVLEIRQKEVIDYTAAVKEQVYFCGAAGLVVHLTSEIALCGVNSKADESLFEEYCEDFELTPFSFDLPEGLVTSDVALFVEDTLLICLEYILDKKMKKDLFSFLKANNIRTVVLTKEQILKGVLDIKFINNKLLMAKYVNNVLTDQQKEDLGVFKTEVLKLPFLEKAGIKLRDVIL